MPGTKSEPLSDGRITEDEVKEILAKAEDEGKVEEVKKDNFIVSFINSLIASIKEKMQKE